MKNVKTTVQVFLILIFMVTGASAYKKSDFIEGITMGNPDLVMGLLFDPKVKTLSW